VQKGSHLLYFCALDAGDHRRSATNTGISRSVLVAYSA